MNEEINKIISENLPEMAAKEMKKFIEEAETLKGGHSVQASYIKELRTDLQTMHEKFDKANAKVIAQDALAEREKKCTEREAEIANDQRSLDNKILETKLEYTERNNEKLFTLVGKVFGHPNVTVNSSTSGGENKYTQNGMADGNSSSSAQTEVRTEHGKD